MNGQNDEKSMKIIINFQSQIHSLDIEALTYEEFQQKIIDYLGNKLSDKFTIKYKDEDDDLVILNNVSDYEMALDDLEVGDALELIVQNVVNKEHQMKEEVVIKEKDVEVQEEEEVQEIPILVIRDNKNKSDDEKPLEQPEQNIIDLHNSSWEK